MITLITAKKQRITTRFVVGCPAEALAVKEALDLRGYMTAMKETEERVERPQEERLRASRIIGEMFGH